MRSSLRGESRILSLTECREEPLGERDRAAFDCGHKYLDAYFQNDNRILRDIRNLETAVFVVVDSDENIVGYYTLSNTSVVKSDLSRKDQKSVSYPEVSATLIGRLAVHRQYQRNASLKLGGFGRNLLERALQRAARASYESGSALVLVHTIDDRARSLYSDAGFKLFP